jgi:hypothetical protein
VNGNPPKTAASSRESETLLCRAKIMLRRAEKLRATKFKFRRI